MSTPTVDRPTATSVSRDYVAPRPGLFSRAVRWVRDQIGRAHV